MLNGQGRDGDEGRHRRGEDEVQRTQGVAGYFVGRAQAERLLTEEPAAAGQ